VPALRPVLESVLAAFGSRATPADRGLEDGRQPEPAALQVGGALSPPW
jgi:hypothetical protein